MKQVLITGRSGYIGSSLAHFLETRCPADYRVSLLSLRDGLWRQADFSRYDAVVHAAGIAHIRETAENAPLYYQVNRDLAVELAEKAKQDGVGKFLFISSGSVYGLTEGVITQNTPACPVSAYGKSKLQAEEAIASLRSEDFTVIIFRPMMVYGEGCKGNYQALVKLARILPVLPDYHNRRSLVSIDTLCEKMQEMIAKESRSGICFPREQADLCTCEMIQQIALQRGRHLKRVKVLNPAVSLLRRCTGVGKKAFGDLIYQDLSFCPL